MVEKRRARHASIATLAALSVATFGCGRLEFDVLPFSDRDPDLGADAGDASISRCARPLVETRLPITADEDDGEIGVVDNLFEPQGELNTDDGVETRVLYAGSWHGGPTWSYFRFRASQPVPVDWELVAAELELWGADIDGAWDSGADALVVRLENSGSAAAVRGLEDAPGEPDGRILLPREVRWPSSGGLEWQIGAVNASPNLAALMFDLRAAQPELTQSNHIQLWVSGDSVEDKEVGTVDVSLGTDRHARLHFTWCPPDA